MNRRRIVRASVALAVILLLAALLYGVLVWFGVVQLGGSAAKKYEIHGVDVSEYQGEINWEVFAGQDVDFVFCKATEGSGYVDSQFAANWENAAKKGMRAGAYHFFSFDSSGETQAENFIAAVSEKEGMLPPVVDVEYYGDYRESPPSQASVETQLQVLLTQLEETYGIKPILYVTKDTLWLTESFSEYDFWVRSVYGKQPRCNWTFWQYSNRLVLDGYDGEERYIDGNVFYGTAEEFRNYGKV